MLTPQEIEEKYAKTIAIRKYEDVKREAYTIEFIGKINGNDGSDGIDKFDTERHDKIQVKSIFKDELFFLLLCYLYDEDYEFNSGTKISDEDDDPAVCGINFGHDLNFPWLKSYLSEIDICTDAVDDFYVVNIYWRDYDGIYLCYLPDMSTLFETRGEMIDYINTLYKATRSN